MCSACQNRTGNRVLHIPGDPAVTSDRDYFGYVECGDCGTLDIAVVPPDLAQYYADAYYSFHATLPQGLRGLARRMRNTAEVFGTGFIGRVLANWSPMIRMSLLHPLVRGEIGGGLSQASAILDVGCGNGAWLRSLQEIGFANLTGIDPFLQRPVDETGLHLKRAGIYELQGAFDLISCSHVLEHTEDPERALRQMMARLRPGGCILLRIPLAQSYAWRIYGGEWVQLDAPRHLHLYSLEGVRILTSRVGLDIRRTVFDSSAFSLLGSEARLAGCGPHQANNDHLRPAEVMAAFDGVGATRIARMINCLGTADQASFFLQVQG